jgi:transcriptional antiterminator Rof (Rho-off)
MNKELANAWGAAIDWPAWEMLIRANGVTVDRPRRTTHPVHATIVYPIDYGYVNGTMATDNEEIDVFIGTAATGLVGAIWTTDHRKGDRECKFLLDCSPEEIYLAHGFLNFDPSLMEGRLVLRQPMRDLWNLEASAPDEPAAYVPIDCGFYDRLEHWAVRGEECEILVADGSSFRDRFVDFENSDGVEYAHLASGERLRLDQIAAVNGIPVPPPAC